VINILLIPKDPLYSLNICLGGGKAPLTVDARVEKNNFSVFKDKGSRRV
jgi:hypothetical protein